MGRRYIQEWLCAFRKRWDAGCDCSDFGKLPYRKQGRKFWNRAKSSARLLQMGKLRTWFFYLPLQLAEVTWRYSARLESGHVDVFSRLHSRLIEECCCMDWAESLSVIFTDGSKTCCAENVECLHCMWGLQQSDRISVQRGRTFSNS